MLFSGVLYTYNKGECSKKVLNVVDVCSNGIKLKWVKYLTNEILSNTLYGKYKTQYFLFVTFLLLIAFLQWTKPTRVKLRDVYPESPIVSYLYDSLTCYIDRIEKVVIDTIF